MEKPITPGSAWARIWENASNSIWLWTVLGAGIATYSCKHPMLHALCCSALGSAFVYYLGMFRARLICYGAFMLSLPLGWLYVRYLNGSGAFEPALTRPQIGLISMNWSINGFVFMFIGAFLSFFLGTLLSAAQGPGPRPPRRMA